jgi:hypothetical protein
MCIPIWFGFGPHSEDGYGLSPAKRVSKIGAVSIVLMLIGWIMGTLKHINHPATN